ncbi:hypothetical protein KKA95_03650 [Patescibacteria group bacterium]|nr:hypothetical protein [Patescibacteria group bacterium]
MKVPNSIAPITAAAALAFSPAEGLANDIPNDNNQDEFVLRLQKHEDFEEDYVRRELQMAIEAIQALREEVDTCVVSSGGYYRECELGGQALTCSASTSIGLDENELRCWGEYEGLYKTWEPEILVTTNTKTRRYGRDKVSYSRNTGTSHYYLSILDAYLKTRKERPVIIAGRSYDNPHDAASKENIKLFRELRREAIALIKKVRLTTKRKTTSQEP